MGYKGIHKLLEDEEKSQSLNTSKLQGDDISAKKTEMEHSVVTFIGEKDDLYKRGCSVDSVANAVRVEQGEFAVLRKSSSARPIGTHHVTPCVVICVTSSNYFGLAHFDSYRTPESLAEFFNKFKNDGAVKIQIFGGRPGFDPLRNGTENKQEVLAYIGSNLSNAEVKIIEPASSSINLVFDQEGTAQLKKFAVGIEGDKEAGVLMRLRHNVGGIVTAQQSRTESFIPLNFIEAYQGDDQPVFLDRLALKAINEFDARPIAGEEHGWTTDPGGYVLTQEMQYAHEIISYEVKQQKLDMESALQEVVYNAELRKRLVDLCPIYIGPHADAENFKIVQFIKNLYSEHENADSVLSKALILFNKESSYPLLAELVPVIETAYGLHKDSLATALNEQFGTIDNLAYGVDVVAPNIVFIINDLRQKANPGLMLAQQLQTHSVDTRTLLANLCKFYKIQEHDLLTEITQEYNSALAEDNNIDKIISELDNKNSLSKDNILQILSRHYTCVKMRMINKLFERYWEAAIDPKAALEEVISKIPPEVPFNWKREYNELAKAFHSAHLQTREAQDLIELSLDETQSGVKGVINKIFKDAIITVMSRNPVFEADYT